MHAEIEEADARQPKHQARRLPAEDAAGPAAVRCVGLDAEGGDSIRPPPSVLPVCPERPGSFQKHVSVARQSVTEGEVSTAAGEIGGDGVAGGCQCDRRLRTVDLALEQLEGAQSGQRDARGTVAPPTPADPSACSVGTKLPGAVKSPARNSLSIWRPSL